METLEEIRCTAAWRNSANVQRSCSGTSRLIAGENPPILGMSDAEYADAIARAGELDSDAAKAYAATHRVLCAHADDDGRGAHWLAPGEKCTLSAERETEAAAPPGREEQQDPQAGEGGRAGPEMEPGG